MRTIMTIARTCAFACSILTLLSPLAHAITTAVPLTYAILVNEYGGVFPNCNDAIQNTIQLNYLIRANDMRNNHTARTVHFAAGIYEFNVNVEGGGQLAPFENMGNLTLEGATNGQTILRWYSGNSNGQGTGPVSDPQHFWSFDKNCRNITIRYLEFDTPYTTRYYAGQHIRFVGKHLNVEYNTFRHSPNFGIQIADGNADLDPEYVNINSNSFIDCIGDPIHIHNGQEVVIVGNYIQNSGDDAIAIVADDFLNDGLKANGVYILANTINGSSWRGIAVITADNVHIQNNFIHGAALHGIETVPITTERNIRYDAAVPENEWTHNVEIRDNTIQYAGYPLARDGIFHNSDATGITQRNARGVIATGNDIHDIKSHGIHLRWVTDSEYGSLSRIQSFGTGGSGDAIYGEGYLDNITTWIYSPGN